MKSLIWCALFCLLIGQAYADETDLNEQQKQELKICNMDEIPIGLGFSDATIELDEKDQQNCRKIVKAKGTLERYKVCQKIFDKGSEKRKSCIEHILKESPCAKLRKNAPKDFQKCLHMQKQANRFAGCKKETGHHISCREGTYKFQGAFSPIEVHSGAREGGKNGFIDYVQDGANGDSGGAASEQR